MTHRKTDWGFILVEILIVVVIMAVVAATIIRNSGTQSTAQYNSRGLRTLLEVYRGQHGLKYPTRLDLLCKQTNVDHTESGGTLGPYCFEIPGDGVTGDETVTIIDSWQTLPESVKADILSIVKAGE